MARIPLIKPFMSEDIKRAVCGVLDTGFMTEGPVTRQLEQAFADYTGSRHALAVSNCTVGLEMALRALGVGPGDEVVVPDYTYPATADVVETVGARVVLTDVDPETMLMDLDALEQAITPRVRAVIPVSLFGNPLDHDRLAQLKEKYQFHLIEDAACAIGSEYKGRRTGSLADISVFSLHPRKFITTGEGGMITTNSTDWATWLNSYKHFGLIPDASTPTFQMIGSNHKLSDVLAAIGLEQMKRIDELLERRQWLARQYVERLRDQPGVHLPRVTEGGVHSYQTFCVFVEERNAIKRFMRDQGIEVQIGTFSLHAQPAFSGKDYCRIAGSLSQSRYAFDHCLALPLYHDLTEEQQDDVVDTLKSALSDARLGG